MISQEQVIDFYDFAAFNNKQRKHCNVFPLPS